jgi:hypothetical protein
VIVWETRNQGGTFSAIYAQRYALNAAPSVALADDTPDPVMAGNTLTLSASGVLGDLPIGSVSFYRETNGLSGLQVGAEGDTFVAADTTPSGGFWSVSFSTASIPAGLYTYHAQATDINGLAGTPASTTNTVIGGAPTVTASDFHFLTAPQNLTFTFDQDVSASLTLADLTVDDLTHGTTVTPNGLSYNNATNTATVSFSGILADANYRAMLHAAGITNAGGTPMASDHALNFFFLNGDANRDRIVDVTDLGILATNWQGNGDFAHADFNLDGHIDVTDLGILATNWQKALPAPSTPLTHLRARKADDTSAPTDFS